jgi:hypothetical protein
MVLVTDPLGAACAFRIVSPNDSPPADELPSTTALIDHDPLGARVTLTLDDKGHTVIHSLTPS